MKFVMLCFLLLILYTPSYGQHFSIRELSSFISIESSEIESILYKKGFYFLDVKQETSKSGFIEYRYFSTKDKKFLIEITIDRHKINNNEYKIFAEQIVYKFNEQSILEEYKKFINSDKSFYVGLDFSNDIAIRTSYSSDSFYKKEGYDFGVSLIRRPRDKYKFILSVGIIKKMSQQLIK